MKRNTNKNAREIPGPRWGRNGCYAIKWLMGLLFLMMILMYELVLYVQQIDFISDEMKYISEQDIFINKIECKIDDAIYAVETQTICVPVFDMESPQIAEWLVKKSRLPKLSKKEKEVLFRIVEAEAGGEDKIGKRLVADVVINRVKDKRFPDTVTDVVFDHRGGLYQFSPIMDGRFQKVKVSKETKEAVEEALAGEDCSNGAIYFVAPKAADAGNLCWFERSLCLKVRHGLHCFYR